MTMTGLLALLVAMAAADTAVTIYLLTRYASRAREANPVQAGIFRKLGLIPGALVGKFLPLAAIMGLLWYAMEPAMFRGALWGGIALHAGILFWNSRTWLRLRRLAG